MNYYRIGKKILYSKFYCTMLAGIVAGILNLTGIYGFLFYFIQFFIIGVIILLNNVSKSNCFTDLSSLIHFGLVSNLMIYVIFWIMFYNFVHIY